MKKIFTFMIIVTLVLATLTGCWNRRELNQLYIAVGMAIDKTKNGYEVSVQVVNPSAISQTAGAGGGNSPVSVYSATGKTLFESIRKVIKSSSRKTYFAHLRLLVFSEELARDGVEKTLDMIWRNQEFRPDFFLVISKEKRAKDILEVVTPIEKIPANHAFFTLEESEQAWAPTVAVDLDEFITDLMVEGKNPVLGGIAIHGDSGKKLSNISKTSPDARLVASHIGIFKKDKLVGWLNKDESKGFNYIMGNVKSTIGFVSCPNGEKVTNEVIRTQSKIEGHVINQKPSITVSLSFDQNVVDVECDWDISDQATIKQIEIKTNNKVKMLMEKAVKKAKQKNTDIFGFGSVIHKSYPQEWKQMQKNWDKEFQNLDVKIIVNAKIREFGRTNQSLIKELKE